MQMPVSAAARWIVSPKRVSACESVSIRCRMRSMSSPPTASRRAFRASSTGLRSVSLTRVPCSCNCFSAVYIAASAWLRASTNSRRFRSSSACASASLTILWMSASDRPPEAWMRICCSLPVALSFAVTLTMPLASMSKVTSICGTPRGAGGMPTRSN
ncbi:hypothetical protein ABAZ39_14720 (plasmid) [Azospirillum argentinense]|uniref:Uncharacterized protein n=1 Tax=Azospirillum argentinense TaxID=2970906 RepID=A0A060DPV5_9PROT|nr:hypothetical protein ABAZ39_14720 [Azospirillum argentinense]EZQ06393.1 hypothetical protein ABAZ39_14865 [Azospirillum argentinense]